MEVEQEGTVMPWSQAATTAARTDVDSRSGCEDLWAAGEVCWTEIEVDRVGIRHQILYRAFGNPDTGGDSVC